MRQLGQRLKLLANQQTGGDSLVEMLVGCLQERSGLKLMEELPRFITMDNHEAVKIDDLEKTLDSLSMVKPKLTMGAKMITGPFFFFFLISTFSFGKNNQDSAKDPEFREMAIMISLPELNLAFFSDARTVTSTDDV